MRSRGAARFAFVLVAMAIGCGPGVEDELTHGTVSLEFARGESQADMPLPGTTRIVATMAYLECLSDFYEANATMRQAGPDGARIFGSSDLGGEGWLDRLCSAVVEAELECEVISIEQELEPVAQLTVTYAVSGDLEARRLAFGPLPIAELAQCAPGLEPTVTLEAPQLLRGFAEDDRVLWRALSIWPSSAGAGGAMRVSVTAE